jgi:hypothetical protein
MTRRRRKKSGTREWWSDNQRIEAVTAYLACGSPTQVCVALGIPLPTFNRWKTSTWFKELVEQLRNEDTLKLDAKLTRIVEKSLVQIEDRLDNGNHNYNPRSGAYDRVPVKLADITKAAASLMEKQAKLREIPERAEIDKTIDARLAKLGEEFTKFSKAKTIEGTVINIGDQHGN